MSVVKCILLDIDEAKPGVYIASVKRTSDHPLLGKVNDRITVTSQLKSIDFEQGLITTQNTVYEFK